MPFKTVTWLIFASRSERQRMMGVVPRVSQPLHGSPPLRLVGAGWLLSQSSRVSEKA